MRDKLHHMICIFTQEDEEQGDGEIGESVGRTQPKPNPVIS